MPTASRSPAHQSNYGITIPAIGINISEVQYTRPGNRTSLLPDHFERAAFKYPWNRIMTHAVPQEMPWGGEPSRVCIKGINQTRKEILCFIPLQELRPSLPEVPVPRSPSHLPCTRPQWSGQPRCSPGDILPEWNPVTSGRC